MKTRESHQLSKSVAAKTLGSFGGKTTALRGPDYYREIGSKGLAARWRFKTVGTKPNNNTDKPS